MAEPTFPSERGPGDSGVSEHLRALLASVASYIQARVHLVGLESREAAEHSLKILIWLGLALSTAAFGYVFCCCSLIFILEWALKVSWMWIMLGLGLAHFVVAAVCARIVRKKFPQPMFESTLNEFKKDQEWLSTHSKPN